VRRLLESSHQRSRVVFIWGAVLSGWHRKTSQAGCNVSLKSTRAWTEWDLAVQQMRAATKKGGVVWCAPTGGNSIVIRGTNVSLHLSFVDRWQHRKCFDKQQNGFRGVDPLLWGVAIAHARPPVRQLQRTWVSHNTRFHIN